MSSLFEVPVMRAKRVQMEANDRYSWLCYDGGGERRGGANAGQHALWCGHQLCIPTGRCQSGRGGERRGVVYREWVL